MKFVQTGESFKEILDWVIVVNSGPIFVIYGMTGESFVEIFGERVGISLKISYTDYTESFCVICVLLLRNSFEFNKSTELRYHHSFFTFKPARQGCFVALFSLAFHVIPNLAVRTLTIPAEVAV